MLCSPTMNRLKIPEEEKNQNITESNRKNKYLNKAFAVSGLNELDI